MGCTYGRSLEEQMLEERQLCERRWKELGGEQLEEPLREGWVKLVRADWLVGLSEAGGVLSRRQDLPSEAFIDLDELKRAGVAWGCLRIIVLSYPWLQPGHPDPHGESLRVVAKVLKLYVDREAERRPGPKPYGVLIDFTALFQAVRTEEQEQVFQRALPALHLFYSHPHTMVLKVTQLPPGYPDQGSHEYILPDGATAPPWCFTESLMSGLVNSETVLDLGQLHSGFRNLWDVIEGCKAGRGPPLHPDDFLVELHSKTFSDKRDFERVAELYFAAFELRFAGARVLSYQGLGWGPDELKKLLRALETNHSLKALDLNNNRIGSQGAVVLGDALRANASIRVLSLWENGIGPEGAVALGEALRINTSLVELDLWANGIGPEGAAALGDALRVNTSLRRLCLLNNGIGPEGAAALKKAARRCWGRSPCVVRFDAP